MMNVHKRREYQEAGREVMMESPAGQPWSGNKQRNTADDQDAEIGQRTPLPAGTFAGSLTARIVARDPQVLCRMHDGQHSCAVAVLRDLETFDQRNRGR